MAGTAEQEFREMYWAQSLGCSYYTPVSWKKIEYVILKVTKLPLLSSISKRKVVKLLHRYI